jgi:hypothetical protein
MDEQRQRDSGRARPDCGPMPAEQAGRPQRTVRPGHTSTWPAARHDGIHATTREQGRAGPRLRAPAFASCATDGVADHLGVLSDSPAPCFSAEGGARSCSIVAHRTARLCGPRRARRSHSSRAVVATSGELTSATATSQSPRSRPRGVGRVIAYLSGGPLSRPHPVCVWFTSSFRGCGGALGRADHLRAGAHAYFDPRPSGWLRGR